MNPRIRTAQLLAFPALWQKSIKHSSLFLFETEKDSNVGQRRPSTPFARSSHDDRIRRATGGMLFVAGRQPLK
ncbi:MAG: hypothetical protein IT165_37930 [Bryobacterales bacterium]|nr:hypothetical protein [Bryobacterales bacterium]